MTDLSGYGQGHGYAVRLTDKAVLEEELRCLRALGVNGLAGAARHHLDASWHVIYAQLGGFPVPGARKGQTVPEAGCPSAPGVAQRQSAMIQEGLSAALKMKTDEVWWRTVDEIGSVVDQSPEGKGHFAACAACADAFRAWLKGKGLSPADLGSTEWADVRPTDLLQKEPPAPNDRGAAMRLYQTMMFANVATARLFTPMRDAIARANDEKRRNPSLSQPTVYSFALRGNTFNMGGHSLDFFDFYRHADNAMVYETSNRDPRVWIWDSYLCDVGRILTSRLNTEFGIYVKPHRGAPIQRALSAAARGARMIYWYTYGPDYVKGDSFAENEGALEATARAASILGRAEDLLFRPGWMTAPETAVVNPRSSELWNKMRHAAPRALRERQVDLHGPGPRPHPRGPPRRGDAGDRGPVALQGDLPQRDEPHRRGRGEGRRLGPGRRNALYQRRRSGARRGEPAAHGAGAGARPREPRTGRALGEGQALRRDDPRDVRRRPGGTGDLRPRREVRPGRRPRSPEAGRRHRGRRRVCRRRRGDDAALAREGQVWVAGFYPGLEYSAGVRTADYDMSTGFDAVRRAFVAAPALERVAPTVDAGQPLVEGILLRNEATGKRGVTLMNWAYRQKSLVPFKDLRVAIRGAGPVARATSVVLGTDLPIERSGDVVTVLLPSLNEGDVLRLE